MTGKFITFEGIDGSGKSTQLRILSGELRSRGVDVIVTCEPGGTPLGRLLREAFLETDETVSPLAELLLFAADRAQHVEFLVKPAIAAGRVVISDRFADATAAYQGAGRGFEKATVRDIIRLATGGLKPDITLFFDIPVELALERTRKRDHAESKSNRMDAETADFYSRVRDAYLAIAAAEPKRFKVVDASGSIAEIQAAALSLVNKILK